MLNQNQNNLDDFYQESDSIICKAEEQLKKAALILNS